MCPTSPTRVPWRDTSRRTRQRAVWLLGVAAGVGAAAADAAPTGRHDVDVVLAVLTGLVLTWFASRARRWSLPLVAAPGLALGTTVGTVAGAVALALALVSIRQESRDRLLTACTGAVAVQGLFRLNGDLLPFGAATVVAVAAAAVLVVSSLRQMRPRLRRRVLVVAGVVLLAGAGLAAGATVAAFDARTNVSDAVHAGREAVRALREQDRAGATAAFGVAAADFRDARDALATPWARAARLLPAAAQNLDAADDLAAAGADLAVTSADAIGAVDLEALALRDGRVDLGLVDDLQASTATLVAATSDAIARVDRVDSPWLIGELTSRAEELRHELTENLRTARETRDVLQATPWLLGADAPRRYLVLLTTPAEARELGGFVGAYAVLRADGGRLSFDRGEPVGTVFRDLRDLALAPPDVPLPSAYLLQRPAQTPQSWTGTPDFPTVSSLAQYSMEALGERFDGTIVVDPYVMATLVGYVGGVDLPGTGITVTPDDAVDFLLRDQYLVFGDDQGERKELLPEVAEAVFDELVTGGLPGPSQLIDDLGPLVDGRRLLFTVNDEDADAVLADAGLTGAVGPTGTADTDVVHLATTNVLANKLDAYLRRSIRFSPTVSAEGEITGRLMVTLDNEVPPLEELNDYVTGDGGPVDNTLPEDTWWGVVAIYTSLEVDQVAVDGTPVAFGEELAYGLHRYGALVKVPRARSVTVTFDVAEDRGPDLRRDAYRLRWIPNAGALADTVDVRAPN